MTTAVPTDKLGAFGKAMCLDLPYIVDSVWRRAEFNLNRWVRYEVTGSKGATTTVAFDRRTYSHCPPFWFFLVTLVFVSYGPTFDAWCSVVGSDGMRVTRAVLGALCVWAAFAAWGVLLPYGTGRCVKRFDKAEVPIEECWRRFWVLFGVRVGFFFIAAIPGYFGCFLLFHSDDPVCRMAPPWVPSGAPAKYQAFLLLCTLSYAVWLAAKKLQVPDRIFQQTRILGCLAIILWILIVPCWASEANQSPYIHVYGAFACALAVVACCARPFVQWQFNTVRAEQGATYRRTLLATELFPGSRKDPTITRRLGAILTGVFYNLSEFLLLPSFFALMVPSRFLVCTFCVLCAVAAWLLMLGNFTSRWQAMVVQVQRWFLLGTPLAVSISVIVIAGLRLFKVQYVTTVLDAAPFGVIFVWILMAYSLLWWFEYSVNSALSAELIGVLAEKPEELKLGFIKYDSEVPVGALTVQAPQRYIVPHGCGRFAAVGYFFDKDSGAAEAAFQTFGLLELFERLTPDPLADHWHDLKRRVALYFLTVNAAVIIVLSMGLYLYGYGDRHNTVKAVVTATTNVGTTSGADLAALLRQRKRVFIVAASGGGTRAALFTATALEGLQSVGAAQDIVLLSGVSGGGVAEAYFYSHRASLLSDQNHEEWNKFKARMTDPFIGDVLEGAGEWRLLSRHPLGQLLVESFERRLFQLDGGQATLGQNAQLGIILNTTVTAHPQDDAELLRGVFLPAGRAHDDCDERNIPYALMSGGRLIFTNLTDREAFPDSGAKERVREVLHLKDVALPYVVVQDPSIEMAEAAALNANFPPVFPNARVDVADPAKGSAACSRSYYVTDGGATENLGLISALYALRAALEKMRPADIPEIHIVAIEASATGYDYAPDRGLNAGLGGSKERLTGGLTQALLNEIQQLIPEAQKIDTHLLALPLAFRSRGGFGTHWMFPQGIVVENPQLAAPLPWYSHQWAEWFSKNPPTATITKDHLIELWTALHDPDKRFCARGWKAEQRRIARWICGEDDAGKVSLSQDVQIGEWNRLVDELVPAANSPSGPRQTP